MISQFCESFFPMTDCSTIGVDFRSKMIQTSNKVVKAQIWDTAGQERFKAIAASYYRLADSIIFAYDTSRPETLTSLEDCWLEEARRCGAEACINSGNILIVGTKADLCTEDDHE